MEICIIIWAICKVVRGIVKVIEETDDVVREIVTKPAEVSYRSIPGDGSVVPVSILTYDRRQSVTGRYAGIEGRLPAA